MITRLRKDVRPRLKVLIADVQPAAWIAAAKPHASAAVRVGIILPEESKTTQLRLFIHWQGTSVTLISIRPGLQEPGDNWYGNMRVRSARCGSGAKCSEACLPSGLASYAYFCSTFEIFGSFVH